MGDPAPHTLTIEEVVGRLSTSIEAGLDPREAQIRRDRHGPNLVPDPGGRGLWTLLREQVTDVMVLVLVGAAILAGYVGEPQDAVVIAAILILNAVLGVVQASRAERALTALKALAAPDAIVRRGMREVTIPAADLVPGDVVLLEAGNLVPADLRITDAQALRIDESALTGESQSVSKTTATLSDRRLPLGDRRNLAYKGTLVTFGRGIGLVVAIGPETEIGHLAALLSTGERARTPLQKRLDLVGRRLAAAALALCATVFVIGWSQGELAALMLLTAISLAVAAVPEALPAVVSIALAIGARRMARRQALVRHLPAVETLGSVTYICADKTGTLTENRMRAAAFWVEGTLVAANQTAALAQSRLFWQAMALCNDTRLEEGVWRGDPTEVALVEAAEQVGYRRLALIDELPRFKEVPFSSERALMTTVHDGRNGLISFTKGAPEQVLERCDWADPRDRSTAALAAEQLAAQGHRVLAIAWRRPPPTEDARDPSSALEQHLTLLGVVGLADPPRREAAGAVAECKRAGITPVMITGDHLATARAIAKQVGILGTGGACLVGRDLEEMDGAALARAARDVAVYARVAPEQKIAIVEALQSRGEFVAMTGDGVNDAPALKRADIGVAMGRVGTDVARETADLVLLDDNFATIVIAVAEGRRIFDNIRKFIRYVLTGNAAEISTLLLAPLVGLPTPLRPIQILWINLVTDGLPGLALTLEPEESSVMQRPPRPPNQTVFALGLWQHILRVGLALAFAALSAGVVGYWRGAAHWRTLVFTTLTFGQLALALAARSEHGSSFAREGTSNVVLLVGVVGTAILHLMVLYVPWLNAVFETTPLRLTELLACAALSAGVFLVAEWEKRWARRRFST